MGDYVYMATTDCALVALDAASGKEVWTVPIDDYKTGCYSTLATVELPAALWGNRRSNLIRDRRGTICCSHYGLGP